MDLNALIVWAQFAEVLYVLLSIGSLVLGLAAIGAFAQEKEKSSSVAAGVVCIVLLCTSMFGCYQARLKGMEAVELTKERDGRAYTKGIASGLKDSGLSVPEIQRILEKDGQS